MLLFMALLFRVVALPEDTALQLGDPVWATREAATQRLSWFPQLWLDRVAGRPDLSPEQRARIEAAMTLHEEHVADVVEFVVDLTRTHDESDFFSRGVIVLDVPDHHDLDDEGGDD